MIRCYACGYNEDTECNAFLLTNKGVKDILLCEYCWADEHIEGSLYCEDCDCVYIIKRRTKPYKCVCGTQLIYKISSVEKRDRVIQEIKSRLIKNRGLISRVDI